jgi:hypothetical protein
MRRERGAATKSPLIKEKPVVDHDLTTMPAAEGQDDTDNTLAYPISPDYVKSWTFTCTCQAKLLVNNRASFSHVRHGPVVSMPADVRGPEARNRPGVGVRLPAIRQSQSDNTTVWSLH